MNESETEAVWSVERHDGDTEPDCVRQWYCGCNVHPIGKPWGWNGSAWDAHICVSAPAHPAERAQVTENARVRSPE